MRMREKCLLLSLVVWPSTSADVHGLADAALLSAGAAHGFKCSCKNSTAALTEVESLPMVGSICSEVFT